MVFSYWDQQGETDDKYINLERRNLSAAQLSYQEVRRGKKCACGSLSGF